MTEYLVGKGVMVNEKVPAGDGGISFGQVGYVLKQGGEI
jgi:hydrogenase maturation factor HypF (carbamoyltransferase family)